MQPQIKELIAALPVENEAPEKSDERTEQRLREIFADIAKRRLPLGSLHRLWTLGDLSAQVALAYSAYWVRGWFLGAEARKQRLMETNMRVALKMVYRMGYLRGAVAKVGQTLGNLPEILPEQIVSTLDRLHFEAPPMHFSLLREMFRNEMGRDPEDVFESFEREAFAAASIGQVHRATLKTGEKVAVKIQYPGIARTIDADMRNMGALMFPQRLGKDWKSMSAIFGEIHRMLKLEADYVQEAENLQRARELFRPEDGIVVPRVYPEYSTTRVLTADYIPGLHLDKFLATRPSQKQRDQFGTKLMTSHYRLYYAGLPYADPHPGNYLFMADGKLGLLDFGCMLHYGPKEFDQLRALEDLISKGLDALPEYLRSAGVEEKNARNAEAVGLVEAFIKWSVRPLQQAGPVDCGDPAHLKEAIDILSKIVAKRYSHSDPMYLYHLRSVLGSSAMLLRLRSRLEPKAIHDREVQAWLQHSN